MLDLQEVVHELCPCFKGFICSSWVEVLVKKGIFHLGNVPTLALLNGVAHCIFLCLDFFFDWFGFRAQPCCCSDITLLHFKWEKCICNICCSEFEIVVLCQMQPIDVHFVVILTALDGVLRVARCAFRQIALFAVIFIHRLHWQASHFVAMTVISSFDYRCFGNIQRETH